VRGITYLEGNLHENKLVNGTTCEIFVEVIEIISVKLDK
jgi:hypothetical protein